MHTVFITGCSGYIGALLVDRLSKRQDVDLIVGLDKEPLPKLIQENKKLHFIQGNTDGDWEMEVARYKPDIVIHCAWQIRELYGASDIQTRWNINGTHQVFDFVFGSGSVRKCIHFGSVASYGAFRNNRPEFVFTEESPLRKSSYKYAEEKRISETMLTDLYQKYEDHAKQMPQIFTVRPASITGPYGKKRTKFSLQSILSGTVRDGIVSRFIARALSFTPVSSGWARQFVHEDDVCGAVEHLAFESFSTSKDVFNLCPSGEYIDGATMASILGKKPVSLPAFLYNIIFWLAWNLTRGRVPTPRGSYKTYAYPIVVDGTKITREYGYIYKYDTRQSFTTKEGLYSDV
jgi:nucleoside-diphosphate-sugar epimerase